MSASSLLVLRMCSLPNFLRLTASWLTAARDGEKTGLFLFFGIGFILTGTRLNCAVTHQIFNYYSKVIFAPLADLEMRLEQIILSFSVTIFSLLPFSHDRTCHVIRGDQLRLQVRCICVLSNPNLLHCKLNFRGVSVLFAGYTHEFMW